MSEINLQEHLVHISSPSIQFSISGKKKRIKQVFLLFQVLLFSQRFLSLNLLLIHLHLCLCVEFLWQSQNRGLVTRRTLAQIFEAIRCFASINKKRDLCPQTTWRDLAPSSFCAQWMKEDLFWLVCFPKNLLFSFPKDICCSTCRSFCSSCQTQRYYLQLSASGKCYQNQLWSGGQQGYRVDRGCFWACGRCGGCGSMAAISASGGISPARG